MSSNFQGLGGGSKAKPKNSTKSSYRLADYIFLIGCDITKRQQNQPLEASLGVLYSYPSLNDGILGVKLPSLCFASGYFSSESPVKPVFNALVITDERKREFYVVSVTFYVKHQDAYLPFSLGIYSQFCMYHLFRSVVSGAYSQHIRSCKDVSTFLALFEKDSVLKRAIRRFVDETPAPIHGKLRFLLNVFNDQIAYGLPSLDDFPLHELPLVPLFAILDPAKVVRLLNHMVFDQQMLFISPDTALLGVLLEGLRCLMYPLAWEHVYIPCCPIGILPNILQAPIPFIVGANLKSFSDQISKELVVVDLTTQGDIFSAVPEFPFPHRLVTKLCTQVTEIMKKNVGTHVEWGAMRNTDSAGESSIQMDIREAFLNFFVGLVRDVEKYIDFEHDEFRENDYVFSFSSRKQAFVAGLTKTQAFEQLRLRMAMGAPTMQLYKECVVAKYMEKSCKRVFATKREERAKVTTYTLPVGSPDERDDPTQRMQNMVNDVTNLMTQPNDNTTQATLLTFRSSLHGQIGEYYKGLQDLHRSIQLDDSVVSDEQIDYFISQLSEIEISKAISSFGPRIKRCIVLARNAGRKGMLPSTSMKSLGLKAEQKISVQLRQSLSNLQIELGAVKRQNVAYKTEIAALKEQVAELTSSQVSSHLKQSENWEEYDVVFDIRVDLILDLWFCDPAWGEDVPFLVIHLTLSIYGLFEAGVAIKGSIAAFVGLYNKGKTFLLNKLSEAALPSGSKVTTRGISVKVPKSFDGQMILLDTAGTHAPIQYRSNDALLDRRATELFLQDLIFDITDYHICVVNDLTWQDQEYIDNLVKKLQESQKSFKQVIVVHNFKGCMDVDDALDHWKVCLCSIGKFQLYYGKLKIVPIRFVEFSKGKNSPKSSAPVYVESRVLTEQAQVIESYPDGDEFTRPLRLSNGESAEVRYYISGNVRHVFMGKEYTPCGERFNEASYTLLRSWLRDVVIEYGKVLSPLKSVIESTNKYLSSYVEGSLRVGLDLTGNKGTIKLLDPQVQFRLRPFTLGWLSPKIEFDNFVPLMDKYSHRGAVLYVIELPGVQRQDLKVSQKEWPNVFVEGEKKKQPTEGYTLDHGETKSGNFKIQVWAY